MPPSKGIYAAALTPLHPDLSCDYELLTSHCKHLLQEGCKGVVLFGTSGEGPSFSLAERLHGINFVSKQIDPKKIIISTGCPSIPETAELTKASSHCAAVLIMPPYFFKHVSDEGVIQFYRDVIRLVGNSSLKILLYHIPQLSGVPINLNIVRALCEEFPSTIIGLKDSEGNLPLIESILKEFPDLLVFMGNETLISAAVLKGAAGGINGMANIAPQLLIDLCKSNQRQAEIDRLKDQFNNLPFVPACKYLLEKKSGKSWSAVRPPLKPLTIEQRNRL